ncbi:aspartate/glutamate racemase family protein [Streptomyces endophyticus]|uniref:Aspartate/glutamate racemase family protein n=1 Tax=Streptomyces endophyticus TaxID=714166 RepID=A0ABU6FF69_9ACTN|nr:aspartate/glutamate racemase family protein [Streptomyces endophyticus]MEB8341491.1 aspartate/glutamate racemase family protein [Streptomyces endophyticus]
MSARTPRVCVLHTVAGLPATFDPLLRELAPHTRPYHVVDESLLADTIDHGPLPRTAARLAAYVQQAEAAGADAVLVTCSSVGPFAEQARPLAGIPVLRVDEPMAAEAVRTGNRIAVLATLDSTLTPTADLVRRAATDQGRDITLTTTACPGAYEARTGGDQDRHDRIIAAQAQRLAADHDVLVLAQASMANALAALPKDALGVPVLTSPRSGTAQLATLLGRKGDTP